MSTAAALGQSALPQRLTAIRHSAQATWDKLSDVAELVTPTAKNRAEFIDECKSGKLDGVVVAYRTFGSVDITGLVDGELVKNLPESLKFIAHNGESDISSFCPNLPTNHLERRTALL